MCRENKKTIIEKEKKLKDTKKQKEGYQVRKLEKRIKIDKETEREFFLLAYYSVATVVDNNSHLQPYTSTYHFAALHCTVQLCKLKKGNYLSYSVTMMEQSIGIFTNTV